MSMLYIQHDPHCGEFFLGAGGYIYMDICNIYVIHLYAWGLHYVP